MGIASVEGLASVLFISEMFPDAHVHNAAGRSAAIMQQNWNVTQGRMAARSENDREGEKYEMGTWAV